MTRFKVVLLLRGRTKKVHSPCIRSLVLQFACSVTFGKLLNLSVPQFSHLYDRDEDGIASEGSDMEHIFHSWHVGKS